MANAVTVRRATPNRLSLLVIGDGTATGEVTAAAMLAGMTSGPLKRLWGAPGKRAFAGVAAVDPALPTLAEFRIALLERRCYIEIRPRVQVVDTTGQVNQIAVDVLKDATTASQAQLTFQCQDTAGQEFYLDIIYTGPGAS